jgi:hypothetical protein
MIEIAPQVFKAGRNATDLDGQTSLQVELAVDGPPDSAQEAFGVVLEQMDEDAALDPAAIGDWESAVLGGSLIIRVIGCRSFDETLRAVCDRLQRQGVSGAIDRWAPTPAFTPPNDAPTLSCRLRVRGARSHTGEGRYQWMADDAAYRDALEAVERWSRERSRRARPSSVETTATGWVSPADLDTDVLSAMLREIAELKSAAAACVDSTGFRALAAHPRGGISLVVAGSSLDTDAWETELDELRELMRATASNLVYATARRGWRPRTGLQDGRFPDDWPRRAIDRPRGTAATGTAFEDLFAPDAFGLQLLGPAYAGRLQLNSQAAARWEIEDIGQSRVVASVEPALWFAASPTRQTEPNRVETDPAALEDLNTARADLSGILYQQGALAAEGFGDMADR